MKEQKKYLSPETFEISVTPGGVIATSVITTTVVDDPFTGNTEQDWSSLLP